MAEVKVTTENFQEEVLNQKGLVLVDFWAAWCGPCKMLAPTVSQIAEAHPEIKVCKVNVEENPALADAYGINTIPTLILFKDGQKVNQSVGLVPPDMIEKLWA